MGSRRRDDLASRPWTGRKRHYDLFKELTVGTLVIGIAVVALSAVFGSPDDRGMTLATWAKAAPADFVATATAELGRTSDSATYGPPYTRTQGASQTLGPIDLQSFSGVRIPIDTANDFVIRPLASVPTAQSAVALWRAAGTAQQTSWTDAYTKALAKAPGGSPTGVAAGPYGPVPALTGTLLGMARSGSLDGVIRSEGGFAGLDVTRPTLFLGDGAYFNDLAATLHLSGDQWGVMNETGDYPGQSWLWLFSLWYQIPAIGGAPNADVLAVGLIGLLSIALVLVPFIPGLRTLPRLIPIHRLVWRDYYAKRGTALRSRPRAALDDA
ncbi:MAG: hypothetical protein HIU86_11410 [Acidobacteria bacterium]|nr:hypothetical protein [Acidobacteriota bacterium]